ncbi:hypothetical protein K457DRAFT_475040 [Linnemannia elongata AG-77]|uniref:Uncharacterized protein n=1 Tax=Linnemannia elongata AG-77 TaxID=1314771 RepID=A0A197JY88_9FUNG|nr:hypothetical protein K457DRAFT_475040 [Linnemannia elongata AG-77]
MHFLGCVLSVPACIEQGPCVYVFPCSFACCCVLLLLLPSTAFLLHIFPYLLHCRFRCRCCCRFVMRPSIIGLGKKGQQYQIDGEEKKKGNRLLCCSHHTHTHTHSHTYTQSFPFISPIPVIPSFIALLTLIMQSRNNAMLHPV